MCEGLDCKEYNKIRGLLEEPSYPVLHAIQVDISLKRNNFLILRIVMFAQVLLPRISDMSPNKTLNSQDWESNPDFLLNKSRRRSIIELSWRLMVVLAWRYLNPNLWKYYQSK